MVSASFTATTLAGIERRKPIWHLERLGRRHGEPAHGVASTGPRSERAGGRSTNGLICINVAGAAVERCNEQSDAFESGGNCDWIGSRRLGAAARTSGITDPSTQIASDAPRSIIQRARLVEPLIATAPTTPAEDAALSNTLGNYKSRHLADDLGSLSSFVAAYPHSGWTPAVETNLALLYLHYGYYSKALDALEAAWREGRNTKAWKAKALIDGAVGRLAWLEASLGRTGDLATLLAEIKLRAVSGSATEFVQTAADVLAMAKKDPRHLFLCGPEALSALMLREGARHDQVRFVHTYRASPRGTNLAEVARLADQQKFAYRLVFRKPGQSVPMPAVVHWKVGHFAAIVGEANGRYHVEDPIFPGQETWVTPAALDEEASGYFLVSAKSLADKAWRTVATNEAAGVWGKGPTCCTLPWLARASGSAGKSSLQ